MPYFISTHVAVMNVSPPISSSQCVLMNVSSLEYRVCNNEAVGCDDFSYSDNITTFVFMWTLYICIVRKMFEVFDNVNLFKCVLMNCSISCCLYYTLLCIVECVVCVCVRMFVMYVYIHVNILLLYDSHSCN